jgi:hypothetical protein
VERPVKRLKIEDRVPIVEKQVLPIVAEKPITHSAIDRPKSYYGAVGAKEVNLLWGVGEQIKREIKDTATDSLKAIEKAKKQEVKPVPIVAPIPIVKKVKKPKIKKETGAEYSRQMWDGKIYLQGTKPVTKHHSVRHGKAIVKEMSWGDFGVLKRTYTGSLAKAAPDKKPSFQKWLDYISEVKVAFDNFKNT